MKPMNRREALKLAAAIGAGRNAAAARVTRRYELSQY